MHVLEVKPALKKERAEGLDMTADELLRKFLGSHSGSCAKLRCKSCKEGNLVDGSKEFSSKAAGTQISPANLEEAGWMCGAPTARALASHEETVRAQAF